MEAKKLKNGMRYHLVPFEGTDAVTVLVLTNVGSRHEYDSVWGGSHYIEHLMFKGTKRRPNTIDISKTLDRYGAMFNAYTGKDLTGYYVKIASDKSDVAIDLLHDMLFNSLYDPEEMEREKSVIIEEIKMYEENPIMHISDILEQAMFEGNRLGLDIAGTAKSVTDITRDDLIAYRDAHYIPSEMVVVVAGKVTKDTEKMLEDTFGTVKEGEDPESYEEIEEYELKDIPRIKRQYKPELKQIQIALGYPSPKRGSDDEAVAALLSMILGGSMSSRLFIEVRERRGLCYSIRSSAEGYGDIGVFEIRAGLDSSRLGEALSTIMVEIEKIKDEGITDEELADAKTHAEGKTKLALENSSSRAEFFGRQELFLDDVKTPDEKLEELNKVTKEDVQRVAKEIFNFKKLSIAAIGPYKTDQELLDLLPKQK